MTLSLTLLHPIFISVRVFAFPLGLTVFNNSKPWFNNEVRLLCRKKHAAFKCGDTENYKKLKYEFQRAVSKAKLSYKAKLENKLKANDIKGAWQGLQDIG